MKTFVLVMILFLMSCASATKKNSGYEYFPHTRIFPSYDGTYSLIILKHSTDEYPKIYRIQHSTKKLELFSDLGPGLVGGVRDYQGRNFYFYMDPKSSGNVEIHKIDPESGESKHIMGGGQFYTQIIDFSKSGKELYILSNHWRPPYPQLFRLNYVKGVIERLTEENLPLLNGISDIKGQNFAFVTFNKSGEKEIYWYSKISNRFEKILSTKKKAYLSFFSKSGEYLHINSNIEQSEIQCLKVRLKAPYEIKPFRLKDQGSNRCFFEPRNNLSMELSSGDKPKIYKDFFKVDIPILWPENESVGVLEYIPSDKSFIFQLLEEGKKHQNVKFYKVEVDQPDQIKAVANIPLTYSP